MTTNENTRDGQAAAQPVSATRVLHDHEGFAHPVLARPFEVSSGELHLPDVPGNGLAWDDGAVAHYQADL